MGLLDWLFGTSDEQGEKYQLRQEIDALKQEIARLSDWNGTLEAQRNNALDLAEFFQVNAVSWENAYNVAKSRTSAPTEFELDGREDRLHERLVDLRTQLRALKDQGTMPPQVEGVTG